MRLRDCKPETLQRHIAQRRREKSERTRELRRRLREKAGQDPDPNSIWAEMLRESSNP